MNARFEICGFIVECMTADVRRVYDFAALGLGLMISWQLFSSSSLFMGISRRQRRLNGISPWKMSFTKGGYSFNIDTFNFLEGLIRYILSQFPWR